MNISLSYQAILDRDTKNLSLNNLEISQDAFIVKAETVIGLVAVLMGLSENNLDRTFSV